MGDLDLMVARDQVAEMGRQLIGSLRLWRLTARALGGWRVAGVLAGLLIAPVARLARPAATGWLIAVLTASPSVSAAAWPLALVVLTLVVEDVGTTIGVPVSRMVELRVDGEVRRQIRQEIIRPDTIEHLEDSGFQDQLRLAWHGARGHRIGAMAASLLTAAVQLAQVLAFTVMAAAFSAALAVGLLVVVLVVRALSQSRQRVGSHLVESGAGVMRKADYVREAADSPATAKDVRVFGLSGWLQERYFALSEQYLVSIWNHRTGTARRIMAAYVLFAAAFGAGYAVVAYAAFDGRISVDELVVYIMAIGGIRTGLNAVNDVHQHSADPLSALRAVSARVRGRSPAASVPAARSAPTGDIRLEKVRLRYPGGDRDIFADLDLTIEAGRSLGIVGLNGAGKSTLFKLLTGLYEPTAGRLSVGGVDLADVDPQAWRSRLAVLFQDRPETGISRWWPPLPLAMNTRRAAACTSASLTPRTSQRRSPPSTIASAMARSRYVRSATNNASTCAGPKTRGRVRGVRTSGTP